VVVVDDEDEAESLLDLSEGGESELENVLNRGPINNDLHDPEGEYDLSGMRSERAAFVSFDGFSFAAAFADGLDLLLPRFFLLSLSVVEVEVVFSASACSSIPFLSNNNFFRCDRVQEEVTDDDLVLFLLRDDGLSHKCLG